MSLKLGLAGSLVCALIVAIGGPLLMLAGILVGAVRSSSFINWGATWTKFGQAVLDSQVEAVQLSLIILLPLTLVCRVVLARENRFGKEDD
tara:strand:- start:1116 stop:1388 length:273 start_codon:yes stop_codon:yes gene_type:complete